MAVFSKGIVLAQHKEPALSRPIVRFVNPQTESLFIDADIVPEAPRVTADEIIAAARAAQIVDERDGKQLYRKLLRAKDKAVVVVADAVDDEPYVSSKIAPLLKNSDEVLGGLELAKKVAGTRDAFAMAYHNTIDMETRIPRSVQGVRVMRLQGGYPAPPHASRLSAWPGRKLIVGTGALVFLYRAVYHRRRHSTAFVTVAGNCVANPMNLEVSVGMTVMQTLERCGLSDKPTRVVCGGSMTGIAILDTEKTLITYTTRAVLALKEDERELRYSCIGCGRCERVCPAGLNPMYIHRFVENSYYAQLKPFDAHMCTGCGTCSYVCPSKLTVAASARLARDYALSRFAEDKGEVDELEA